MITREEKSIVTYSIDPDDLNLIVMKHLEKEFMADFNVDTIIKYQTGSRNTLNDISVLVTTTFISGEGDTETQDNEEEK